MRLGIGEVSSSSETLENLQLPQATPEALAICFTTGREKGIKIFQEAKIRLCPTDEFPFMSYRRIPTVANEKRVQASHPGDTALSAPTADYEFHPGNRTD